MRRGAGLMSALAMIRAAIFAGSPGEGWASSARMSRTNEAGVPA
jgi:hypothetical protein